MPAFFLSVLGWSSEKKSGTAMPLFQDINEKSSASQLSGSRAFVCPAFVSLEAMRRLNFGSSDISRDSLLKKKTAAQIVYLNKHKQTYNYEQQFSISCVGSIHLQMYS